MRSTNIAIGLATLLLASCVDGWASGSAGGGDCIEFMCLWTTEAGELQQTGSWNEHEYAYRLNGVPARISRRFDFAHLPDCLAIDLTANVAKDAQLELQLDFAADGAIDARIPLEPGRWTRRTYAQRSPSNSRHVRVSFEKRGPGEVSLRGVNLSEGDDCGSIPLALADDAPCLDDLACTSGHCVLGACSHCGAGGCAEGSACSDARDCASGACAAGVCRACAADGSCGPGEGCSAPSQCASHSCTFGSHPSLVRYPGLEGICGECDTDADCASGHCVLGQCASCVADSDCPTSQRCRYQDPFDAAARTCLPRFNGVLSRGALCEEDIECADGLRCTAGTGQAKRCGGACSGNVDCAGDEVCSNPGSIPSTSQAGVYELLPAFRADPNARINTCYPRIGSERTLNQCVIHAQCPAGASWPSSSPLSQGSCCSGVCINSGVDIETGACEFEASWLN